LRIIIEGGNVRATGGESQAGCKPRPAKAEHGDRTSRERRNRDHRGAPWARSTLATASGATIFTSA